MSVHTDMSVGECLGMDLALLFGDKDVPVFLPSCYRTIVDRWVVEV